MILSEKMAIDWVYGFFSRNGIQCMTTTEIIQWFKYLGNLSHVRNSKSRPNELICDQIIRNIVSHRYTNGIQNYFLIYNGIWIRQW